MSKSKLAHTLKEKNPELSLIETKNIIESFLKILKVELKNDRKVEIRGFGTFYIKKIKEKFSARNPKTGELIYVPKKNKLRFKSSKLLNKIINE